MPPRPPSWSKSRNFGIVIDAGSSGSRVQVYSWLEPEIARQLKRSARESVDVLSKVEKGVESGDGWHLKVEPGISTYGTNPKGVAEYLRPLIELASSVIPPSAHASTPIYLLATAGMRLLPPAQQKAVLLTACVYLQSFDFLLPDCAENVRIISGEEEGLYGWIAVNYLMDGFDSHAKGEAHDASTYGFLDMGGASTQIAFEPSHAERVKHADNLLEVRLRLLSGREVVHPVFVTTWLGFGTNQARERYVAQEVRKHHVEAHEGSTVDDPCLPKSLLLSSDRHADVTLRGTGDFLACVRNTGPLLNKEVKCLDEPCLFNGVHVPRIDFEVNHFIGISEYWYSTQDVWAMGGMYDFVTFERNAVEFCQREWEDIMKDHKAGAKWHSSVELSRLETQCFKAAWVINVLHEGIGIPRLHLDSGGKGDGEDQTKKGVEKAVEKGLAKRPPHFQSVNAVGDVSVSWTLGKMVLEVSRAAPTDLFATNPPHLWSDWAERLPQLDAGNISANSLPLGLISVLVFFLYFFFLSPSSARRRHSLFGYPKRRAGAEFSALAMEEQVGGSGSDSSTSSSASNVGRTMRTHSLGPLRKVAFVLSSALRSWSRSTSPSASLLPTATSSVSRMFDSGPSSAYMRPPPISIPGTEDIYRPRPKPKPFLRPQLPSSASSPSLSTSLAHWNDAPDVSVLIRSHSSTFLPLESPSASDLPLSTIIPASSGISSRPTTPGSRGAPALTKLSRSRDASASDDMGPPGTPPNGMWEDT